MIKIVFVVDVQQTESRLWEASHKTGFLSAAATVRLID